MMLIVYNLLFPLLFILYLPVFLVKLVRRGGCSRDFAARFGFFSAARKRQLRQLRDPVWIHAVSVGEVVAALTFIRHWRQRRPELDVVLSTTTTTGHAMATRRIPERVALIYSPLDFFAIVWRALHLIRPRMLVIFEVEIWPNLISLTARAGVPVALVNGRLSERSAHGYARHSWFFRSLFRRFAVICMQTAADAARVQRVTGTDAAVHVCDTMKFDQVPDVAGGSGRETLDAVFGSGPRQVWTAASTHAGEERLAVAIFARLRHAFPDLRLVLVPRHHERTPEVARVLEEEGLSFRLLQTKPGSGPGPEKADVLLVNVTGVLLSLYAASDLVFVGKSLAGNDGGHNIIEPAIFGKPILHGPNMQHFRAVVATFRERQAAIEVRDEAELEQTLRDLLADAERRRGLGRRAREVVEACRGAVARTLDLLEVRLPSRPPAP